jgi:hypothetical protein
MTDFTESIAFLSIVKILICRLIFAMANSHFCNTPALPSPLLILLLFPVNINECRVLQVSLALRFKFKTDLIINWIYIPYQNPRRETWGKSMTFPAFSGWKLCFPADHKQFLADYWLVISCYFKPWSVEKFNWFKMQWIRLKPMRSDWYLTSSFVYKRLKRLSLVDDEEPNSRKFFLMSVLCTRVRLLLLEGRVVFLQAEIFKSYHMFQKIYQ